MFLSWRSLGAAVLPVVFGLGGCQSAEVCECAETGIIVRMSARLFEHLDVVGFVGPGCATVVPPTRLPSNDGIRIIATAAGACHVKVLFTGGAPTFDGDVDVMSAGCCGGYAASVSVPDFDGGFGDGGAADGSADAPDDVSQLDDAGADGPSTIDSDVADAGAGDGGEG
jgi:hypothetical protein